MADGAPKGSFNMRNPAVKRILQEVKEMAKESGGDFISMPLEDDIFEWQFAIHGPKDSEFEGGVYHGRITLPADYPFKPPSFMLLTPSGRFETQTKICLSISNHHPEHWQPSWSVRTALVALIAFMPTKPSGALGSLEYTKKERRALAIKSRLAAPQFGSAERQRIINEIHEVMLKTAPPVPTTPLVEDDAPSAAQAPAPASPAPAAASASVALKGETSGPAGPLTAELHSESGPSQAPEGSAPQHKDEPQVTDGNPGSSSAGVSEIATNEDEPKTTALHQRRPLPSPEEGEGLIGTEARSQVPDSTARTRGASDTIGHANGQTRSNIASAAQVSNPDSSQERLLTVAAVVLVLAILFILGQKIARAYGGLTFARSDSEL